MGGNALRDSPIEIYFFNDKLSLQIDLKLFFDASLHVPQKISFS